LLKASVFDPALVRDESTVESRRQRCNLTVAGVTTCRVRDLRNTRDLQRKTRTAGEAGVRTRTTGEAGVKLNLTKTATVASPALTVHCRPGASIRCQNWGCSNAYACQIRL